MTRLAMVCVALLACGKSETDPAAKTETKTETGAGPTKVDTPSNEAPAQSDLCKAFDKDAVAAAFGWKGLQKVVGTGTRANGNSTRHCGYVAKGDGAAPNAGLSITFSTDLQFEKKLPVVNLSFKPRDPIEGMEAWSAKEEKKVGLQIVTKGIRILLEADEAGTTSDEAEGKLVEAAKKLVATLPADPKALLEKK
jgi:hypothetical protein